MVAGRTRRHSGTMVAKPEVKSILTPRRRHGRTAKTCAKSCAVGWILSIYAFAVYGAENADLSV